MSASVPPRATAATLNLTHASTGAADLVLSYFAAKGGKDADATIAHFSKQQATYTDAVLGWLVDGYETLHAAYKKSQANYGDNSTYPTLVLGDISGGNGSVLVGFTNTPEVVGSELRVLATFDVRGGKIVRTVDYWDSSAFDDALFEKIRAPLSSFPCDYKEAAVGEHATPAITAVATRLQTAIAAGDADTAASLFDDDAVYEDMGLRVQVIGKAAINRYFGRTLNTAPLGLKSRLRHIVGGDLGGGFEWFASPGSDIVDGVTALTLDAEGMVIRATTVYDARQLGAEKRRSLTLLSTAP